MIAASGSGFIGVFLVECIGMIVVMGLCGTVMRSCNSCG